MLLKGYQKNYASKKRTTFRHDENYNFYISDETANFTEDLERKFSSSVIETYKVEEDGEMIAFP